MNTDKKKHKAKYALFRRFMTKGAYKYEQG